jgi:6-phosphogluconolactonase
MKADIQIFKDTESMDCTAAEIFVAAAARAVDERGRFLAALSGGGTPDGLYRLLAKAPFQGQVDWTNTFFFWGDERCVPPDDEGSNYRQAMEALLSHVPIPEENIQRIRGELEPAEASKSYARVLKDFASPPLDWLRFDLALLGMWADGHTASLFPGSGVESISPTLAVTADYQGRPANRVTLTSAVFNSARQILFLVTGESKAVVLSQVLNGKYSPEQYPAQRIRPSDGQVTWLVDEAAGSEL